MQRGYLTPRFRGAIPSFFYVRCSIIMRNVINRRCDKEIHVEGKIQ